MSTLFAAALAVVAFQTYGANAQGTNATCSASFSWATNSRGQSPCLQAAYLNGACLSDPQDAYVFSLPTGFHYRPPSAAIATPCQCSTVFYSVLAACADCQSREVLPWSAWETNCSTVYTGVWPVNVPPGTSIPAWAFIDVATPDTFNATAAKALSVSDPAESSPAAAPATSISFSATGSASASNNAPSEGSSNSNSGSGHKSNVGPIVGGVVGGVGGAAILGGIIAFLVIRHRRKSSAAAAAQGGTTPLAGSDPAFAPQDSPFPPSGQQPQMYQPQGGYASVPPQSYSPAPAPLSPSTATGPLYNPDDPSTFPGAGGPGSGSGYAPSQYTGGPQSNQTPFSPQPYQHQPGRYTGVAEV